MTLEIAADELNRLLSLPECTKKSKKRERDETQGVSKTKRRKIKKEKKQLKTIPKPKGDLSAPSDTPTSPSSTGDSLNVLDQISQRLAQRNSCTVRVSGLPWKCNPSVIYNLAPDAQAYRIHWNDRLHGCDGIAFLEFASASAAEEHRDRLNNSFCMNRRISATTGKFLAEETDAYDCCKLVLNGLHWKTRVAELAKRFPASCNIQIRPLREPWDKQKPRRAILTFPTPELALRAFDTRQGCSIRRRKVSILWYRNKPDENPAGTDAPKKCLLVSGIKKSVSEADIQAVFPQATCITINRVSGEAVLDYELEEDCTLDWKNAHGLVLHGRKLKVYRKVSCKFSRQPMPQRDDNDESSPFREHYRNTAARKNKIKTKEELGCNSSAEHILKRKKKMNKKKKNIVSTSSTAGSMSNGSEGV